MLVKRLSTAECGGTHDGKGEEYSTNTDCFGTMQKIQERRSQIFLKIHRLYCLVSKMKIKMKDLKMNSSLKNESQLNFVMWLNEIEDCFQKIFFSVFMLVG